MVELDIFEHLGAWNRFRTNNIDGKPTTVKAALLKYNGRPVFKEDRGQIVFNHIEFISEQDQVFWLLKWS